MPAEHTAFDELTRCKSGNGECRKDGEERFSMGIYAGRYCDKHWKESGYRDVPASAFDPAYAGETLEEEEY